MFIRSVNTLAYPKILLVIDYITFPHILGKHLYKGSNWTFYVNRRTQHELNKT